MLNFFSFASLSTENPFVLQTYEQNTKKKKHSEVEYMSAKVRIVWKHAVVV